MAVEHKKIGIITFHASYNCGSMLQAYAMQYFLQKKGFSVEIIDFSSEGQRKLYSLYSKKITLKNLIRNAIFFLHRNRIKNNYRRYEKFKKDKFNLTAYNAATQNQLLDDYFAVIAGADQIWNITISDYDDAYFLPWVKHARKIAYAPSFGAKNIIECSKEPQKYMSYLKSFDFLSIRELNGKRWIYDLIQEDVPVVLDPTLLLDENDYFDIISNDLNLPDKYIFYYSPQYSLTINKLVARISKKYKLPVIAFNSKNFYLRGMNFQKFKLPEFEDPSAYLQLMKNSTMVITTSFHGAIFSTIFKRTFWVIKNGGMYGNDDRASTLLNIIGLNERLVSDEYDEDFNYFKPVDYDEYTLKLAKARDISKKFILAALDDNNEINK